ncbi:MAG: vancomycin resistance histidine kinase VanS, partial [Eubacterium sp.]|nr:vancomycin resistance histidine kinase VanS [Eubacterium sp.]
MKLKNKKENNSDYTKIQLKAFFELLIVAVGTALAVFCIVLLRDYGLGENYPLFIGIILLFCILLLFVVFVFAKRYIKPFQNIDKQLDALLTDNSSEIHLPKELIITEQKLSALKQTMEKRLFETQLAEQRKNDLVVYLAHDIRTPLTSVIGYLNLLDEAKDMPEEQREKYTQITLDKAYRLEKMINEFFEITKYNLQQI